MKTIMPRVVRSLVTAALLIPSMLALSPMPQPDAPIALGRQAVCPQQGQHQAFVQLDAMRRVLICAFTTQSHGGAYKTTPQLLRLGDTLFVSATVELPPGENILFPEVTNVPYQAVYGPLPRGSRLRITTRAPGEAPRGRVALDTTLRVP